MRKLHGIYQSDKYNQLLLYYISIESDKQQEFYLSE